MRCRVKTVYDNNFLGTVESQRTTDGTTSAASAKGKKGALFNIASGFKRQRADKTGAVGIVANQFAVALNHRVDSTHLFGKFVKAVQIFYDLDLIGLCNSKAGTVQVAKSLYHIAKMVVFHFQRKVQKIQPQCTIGFVLHSGRKRLAQRISHKGNQFCIYSNHGLPSS
ncbi:hypothetical protein SDC9_178358 [bioreactor metagenome]|uniref:Uncharacterized protein n=1 Tax=bioreactor metagenome TaxID=1076179 RepID=A0A645GW41_9ZZZZ